MERQAAPTLALNTLRQAIRLAGVFAGPLLISLIASLVLFWPEQILEYYRRLHENFAYSTERADILSSGAALALFYLSIVAMATVLTYSARVLEADDREASGTRSGVWQAIYRWFPPIIGVMPILATAYGLTMSADMGRVLSPDAIAALAAESGVPLFADMLNRLLKSMADANRYVIYSAWGLLAASALFAILSGLIYTRANSGKAFLAFTKRPVSILLSAALIITAIVLVVEFPVGLAQTLGTIAMFSIFVCCLALLTSQLSIWSRISGIPIIPILAGVAILLSVFDLNDNHELRRIDRNGLAVSFGRDQAPLKPALPALEDQLVQWHANRPDKNDEAYKGKKYPVYVVAAQGGGIYAAAQTLTYLTYLQSACERFAHHVFAISGVSGGSVGAAFYSALSSEFSSGVATCPPPDKITGAPSPAARLGQQVTGNVLSQDYLSPLVAAAVFPDFAQRFLPWKIPSWSRARALEQAIENGWETGCEEARRQQDLKSGCEKSLGLLAKGIAGSFDPRGSRPALILNTTETASGRRRVISPFTFDDPSATSDLRPLPISLDYDVPLSAAAVASARFPWLTPAAWFWGAGAAGTVNKLRVADGGYFENSGVATAVELIEQMEDIARRRELPIEIHLLAMTSGGYSDSAFQGLGEFISPISSLLATRVARTYSTIELADRQLGPLDREPKPGQDALAKIRRLQKLGVRDLVTRLPLGWSLSRASVFQIYLQSGRFKLCSPDGKFEQTSTRYFSMDCAKLLIYHQLRGDDLTAELAQKKASISPPSGP